MSTATPSDVDPGVISTNLEDSVIEGYLDDAAAEASDAINDYDEWDASRQMRLEKYLAALRIRELRDRAVTSASRETASMEYDGSPVSALRKQVDRLDPTGTLAYQTDTDRYVGSAR